MSRARGRKNDPRTPKEQAIDPDSPEGRQLGLSHRVQGHPSPIPGGQTHVSNAAAVRERVPVGPSDPEIGMGNAHGVIPGSHTNAERAEHERGPNSVHSPAPRGHPADERPAPIPVFVVQDGRIDVLRSAAPHSITVPASTGTAVRLCGRDSGREEVMLLNESTTTDIRFAQRPSDLNAGGGALLPWPSNSYLRIKTQDELYGLSATGTATTISVIQVFERES